MHWNVASGLEYRMAGTRMTPRSVAKANPPLMELGDPSIAPQQESAIVRSARDDNLTRLLLDELDIGVVLLDSSLQCIG
jgi:hypothetical protein